MGEYFHDIDIVRMPQDIVTKFLKEVLLALLYAEFFLVIDGKMAG